MKKTTLNSGIGILPLVVVLILFAPTPSGAGEGLPRIFPNAPNKITALDERIHLSRAQYFGESWSIIIDSGEWTSVLYFTGVNIILTGRTWAFDAVFQNRNGERIHRHYRTDEEGVQLFADGMQIGRSSYRGKPGLYLITSDEADLKLKVKISNPFGPGIKFGDGNVYLKDGYAAFTFTSVGGRVEGEAEVDGRIINLDGRAVSYHNHSDLLPTEWTDSWFFFTGMGRDCSFVISNPNFTAENGGASLRMFLLSCGEKLIAATNDFSFTPSKFRKSKESGYNVPQRFELDARGAGYRVSGTIEAKIPIEEIDYLARFWRGFRWIARLIFGSPWGHRYFCEYKLKIESADAPQTISGSDFCQLNFFRQ